MCGLFGSATIRDLFCLGIRHQDLSRDCFSLVFHFVLFCVRTLMTLNLQTDRRCVDDSLLCSWLYDLLVASKCWSVVLRNARSSCELFPASLQCGRSMLDGFNLSLASTGGEGLIPFKKPRMLAGMFRLPWRFVRNSTSNKLTSNLRAVVVEHGMMFSCVLL